MNATLERPQAPENSIRLSTPDKVQQRSSAEMSKPQVPNTTAPTNRPAVTPTPSAVRTLEKGRFAAGLGLSSGGITLLLFVAIGLLQRVGLNEWFSLPLVGIVAIVGVMMLGGGFGLMATAAPGFDDGEFERLMDAGNISNVCEDRADSATNASAATRPVEAKPVTEDPEVDAGERSVSV